MTPQSIVHIHGNFLITEITDLFLLAFIID